MRIAFEDWRSEFEKVAYVLATVCGAVGRGLPLMTRHSSWAHRIWSDRTPAIDGLQWQALQWWSFHRPAWTALASWIRPTLVEIQPLDPDHPAIIAAAEALYRPL